MKAYIQFALALSAKAINARASSSRRRDFNPATAKYDFRVFLLKLGLIGEELRAASRSRPSDSHLRCSRPVSSLRS